MSLFKIFGKKREASAEPTTETVAPLKPSASEVNVSKKSSLYYVVDKYGMPHAIRVSEEN